MILKAGSPVELTHAVLQTLHGNGITTAEQFLKRDPHSVPLEPSLVLSLQKKIYSKFVLEPRTLSSLYDRAAKNQSIISTGSRRVDEVLGGGFYTEEHVDICGDPDVRSDFCLQCISNMVRKDSSASIIYIDSGSNFYPEKLLSAFDCEQEQLKRIQVFFLTDIAEVLTFLDQLQKGRFRPRLIVINAFVDIVKPFMISNDPLAALGLLNHIAVTIRSIAAHLKLALLTTNDLIQNEPSLGKMWLGSPHMRIAVRSLEDIDVMKSTRKL